jgi:hypothetical protein
VLLVAQQIQTAQNLARVTCSATRPPGVARATRYGKLNCMQDLGLDLLDVASSDEPAASD